MPAMPTATLINDFAAVSIDVYMNKTIQESFRACSSNKNVTAENCLAV